MATREEIDSVLTAVNIVDVISIHVALKQQGQIWKGLCPFHSEKTPSFNVNPSTGFFHCFGCGKSGDAISFLVETEGLTFIEGLTRLADSVGITLSNKTGTDPNTQKKDKLYYALEIATQYYQQCLQRADDPLKYLTDRGISDSAIKTFRLGYASESNDALANFLRRNKVDIDDAIVAGVMTKGDREYGSAWDKMRSRIVCPIVDIHDRPIAFGGRLMIDIENRPKYLNTAETSIFSKGRTFFGMSLARKAIVDSGYGIVVEGYFDVISANQAGFKNVVATLGTAMTEHHVDQLARHTQQVRLAFDADAAGVNAAEKSAKLFEAKQIDTLVLDLPAGEDPDSLLRSGKTAEFRAAIDNARAIREFKLRTLLATMPSQVKTDNDANQFFKRVIMPVLVSTKSVIERDRYIRMCAPSHPDYSKGALYVEAKIREELQMSESGSDRTAKPQFAGRQWGRQKSAASITREQISMKAAPLSSSIQLAEEILLLALASDDKEVSTIVYDALESDEVFVSSAARGLAQRMLNAHATKLGFSGTLLVQNEDGTADSEIASLVSRIFTGASVNAPLTVELVRDSLSRLRRESNVHQERGLKALADTMDVAAREELLRVVRDAHAIKN